MTYKTPDPTLVEIGKRILEYRRKANLSQEELADKADMSEQVVSTAERGVKELKIKNLMKISNAMNVSADYLLTGNVVDKDFSVIIKKLKTLTPEQVKKIEVIIDGCIDLCNNDTQKNSERCRGKA